MPIYQQIAEQVKTLIINSQLKPGEQIPAVRELAKWLEVNPSTVARAYFDLKQEGLVVTSRRRGTIIRGDEGYWKNNYEDQSQFIGKVNITANPDQGTGFRQIEATLALHPAYWQVQRST